MPFSRTRKSRGASKAPALILSPNPTRRPPKSSGARSKAGAGWCAQSGRQLTRSFPAKALTRAAALVDAGLAPSQELAELERVAARYAVSLTADVVELIDPSDPVDPIARQFVPDPAELDVLPNERADPIG